ncbi:5,10-methylenetetrahydrofolate reductase (NAD(P)) [Ruminococcus sp. YE71]|nr:MULTISPECIES: methylenetetrahydrofolate reductase [NAD(P)H] [unclassified Ruminococcus]SDA10409.1 5,10-methylenetetrahydrofolate reductase (NAD(P)) [Ruminococcus sp. YE78]SFW10736.1 5,10-methylenetetrahydrofolate reductase (NAD(P)) [Ruminococcus sp. YE71]
MQMKEIFTEGRTVFSMEVFPPKKTDPVSEIYSTLEGLSDTKPDFISCTYGAGGNPADTSTVDICRAIREKFGILPIAHLTCVNNTREDIDRAIALFREAGVTNVLALRGDYSDRVPPKDDFHYASELITYLKEHAPEISVSAACYPETHPAAVSAVDDILRMKEKEQCGAEHFMSQLFFDNEDFYEFREKTQIAGIRSPIEAGIMPVTTKAGILRMVSMCGASIPKKLARLLNRYENDPTALRDACIAYAIDQIVDLIANDVDGIHLYSMNKPEIAGRIYDAVKNLL